MDAMANRRTHFHVLYVIRGKVRVDSMPRTLVDAHAYSRKFKQASLVERERAHCDVCEPKG